MIINIKTSKNNDEEIDIKDIIGGNYQNSKSVHNWLVSRTKDEELLNDTQKKISDLNLEDDRIKFKENILACVNHYKFEDDSRTMLMCTFVVALMFIVIDKFFESIIGNNWGILTADFILFIIAFYVVKFITFRDEKHSIYYFRLLFFIENL